LAWIHVVHIGSSFVYPSIRDGGIVGIMWARQRCTGRDSEIVRGFQVGFGDSVADGHSGMVLAVLGEAVWSGLVVGSVECMIDGTVVCALDDGTVVCALDDGMVVCVLDDGMVVCALDDVTVMCALDDALVFFFFLEVDFVCMPSTVEVSAVARDII
jgi:hypothetical protein